MNAEEFSKYMSEKSDKDYGLCCTPIAAQEGLQILINHFLGKDWYVVMPVCQEQVNTEAIYYILKKYPKKKSFKEVIEQYKKNLKDKFLCNKYRNKDASNGGCMGFSADWKDTYEMCLKCKKFYENIDK